MRLKISHFKIMLRHQLPAIVLIITARSVALKKRKPSKLLTRPLTLQPEVVPPLTMQNKLPTAQFTALAKAPKSHTSTTVDARIAREPSTEPSMRLETWASRSGKANRSQHLSHRLTVALTWMMIPTWNKPTTYCRRRLTKTSQNINRRRHNSRSKRNNKRLMRSRCSIKPLIQSQRKRRCQVTQP